MAREAIFLGYRRDDTADVAGRIYDAMAQRFGKQRVFKDVDSIGPGIDFGDYIKTVLPRCRVALVLIGPHWLESKDESGGRRLDNDHDLVRVEVETALSTPGLLVVPVLVNGARMPRGDEVPDSLRPLLRRNAAIIRRDPDFHDDVERLATAIRASVNTGIIDLSRIGGKASAPAPVTRERGVSRAPLLIGGAIAAVLTLVAIGFDVSGYWPMQSAETAEERAATQPPPQDVAEATPPTQEPPAQRPLVPTPTQSVSVTQPASMRSDAQLWSTLRESSSPAALRAFIRDYPSSEFTPTARTRLASLDEAAWRVARGEDGYDLSEATLNEYLRNFPSGAHAAQARQWLAVPTEKVHLSGPSRSNCAAINEANVFFEWDRSNLNQAALETIDALVTNIRQPDYGPFRFVEVVGHDDTSGLAFFSLSVSERRATVVRDALVARGVDPNVISTWAAGELEQYRQTRDGVREPLNRRTSIVICR